MNIDNELRRDASRYRAQQPPAGLSDKLQRALARASRPLPARRWYFPSVAALAASMVLVLLVGATWGGAGLGGLESAVRGPAFYDDADSESCPFITEPETVTDGNEQQRQYAEEPDADISGAKPWIPAAAGGIFALLATLTGGLLCVGLWGRRVLLPLLLALAGLTTVGLVVLLG